MYWHLIKKQLLLFIRNPHELLILLGMPLVLISILGIALGGVMQSETPKIEAKVAFVEHGSSEQDFEILKKEVESRSIPEAAKVELLKGAEDIQPIKVLRDEIFGSDEMKSFFSLESISPDQLEEVKKNDDYTAIIEVPKHFSYTLLESIYLKGDEVPSLTLTVNEGKSLSSNVVEDVLIEFQSQLTTMTRLGQAGVDLGEVEIGDTVEGEVTSVSSREPIGSIVYYTVGMSVMFVLYVASSIGSFAYREKAWHVFDRLILANVSKAVYFSSVVTSSIILSFLQLCLLYGVTALVYGVHWPDLFSFFIVTLCLSFAVGGIAALLTSLNYRAKSEGFSGIYSSILVTVLAFLGGSFFPIGDLSETMQRVGEAIPNGNGLMAYLKIFQGYPLADVASNLYWLLAFGAALMVMASFIFPRKGGEV
ncbi:ABC-2 type transport system permease protein [Bacillus pakistanensis]|uniref:ABC-2 type transport system permease protein n=1 Tax=Rossellomorea pakistanensis TaxID=992288 RepID=A0ABS2NJP0_9BACI|nr:ABC transporter permease [Bacillus pakistanensis]MBM7588063.1 ABC-2 type transport system permease protein [Bacillus pakistanensis]